MSLSSQGWRLKTTPRRPPQELTAMNRCQSTAKASREAKREEAVLGAARRS